ncbi:MAG: protein kinase domain-containing protein [Acidimicrobiales bacterium]
MIADQVFPSAGQVVRMVRSGTPIQIAARVAEGGQGVVYRGTTETGVLLAVKWYRPSRLAARQREAIASLSAHGRPHPAFSWPIDVVECDEVQGFGYVMPWVPDRFQSLVALLKSPQQPPFRVIADIGRELTGAFAALHAKGLCYRDINFGNLLVDPAQPEVVIVDNDNVGTESGDSFIKGTLRFMAPEVIRGDAQPSTVTDLYSLSVFLFFLLVHGHPLEGRRVRASYTWEPDGHVSETKLAARFFGEDPVFVFDPDNTSNSPEPGDAMLTWWPIYPKFIRDLFIRAFGSGLKDASLGGRITESEWRQALLRLRDCVSVCACNASIFWDPSDPSARCWRCQAVPTPHPVLSLPGHSVVLTEGASLTSHHLFRDLDYKTTKATVEPHPARPGEVVLRNLSDVTWSVEPDGEEPKPAKPGQRVWVRPATISFGSIRGTVHIPGT